MVIACKNAELVAAHYIRSTHQPPLPIVYFYKALQAFHLLCMIAVQLPSSSSLNVSAPFSGGVVQQGGLRREAQYLTRYKNSNLPTNNREWAQLSDACSLCL